MCSTVRVQAQVRQIRGEKGDGEGQRCVQELCLMAAAERLGGSEVEGEGDGGRWTMRRWRGEGSGGARRGEEEGLCFGANAGGLTIPGRDAGKERRTLVEGAGGTGRGPDLARARSVVLQNRGHGRTGWPWEDRVVWDSMGTCCHTAVYAAQKVLILHNDASEMARSRLSGSTIANG